MQNSMSFTVLVFVTTAWLCVLGSPTLAADWTSAYGSVGGSSKTIFDLRIHSNELYAIGDFSDVDGTSALSIARHDGSAWSSVEGNTFKGGLPRVLGSFAGDLIVAGYFSLLESNGLGVYVNGIAGLGSGGYYSLGGGVHGGVVNALFDDGATLWVGGNFTRVGGSVIGPGDVLANAVAIWDGVNWSAGKSLPGHGGTVRAITKFGGEVYIGGSQLDHDGSQLTPPHAILKWNAVQGQWQPLGGGLTYDFLHYEPVVYAMAVYDGELYVGGQFSGFLNASSSGTATHIARWDGSAWSDVAGVLLETTTTSGLGWTPNIHELAVDGDDLIVAGGMRKLNGANVNRIARWNAATASWWLYPPSSYHTSASFQGQVYSVESFGGMLVAAGRFELQLGAAEVVSGIASWDPAAPGATPSEAISEMLQPFPNPFNPRAVVPFLMHEGGDVVIQVADVRGRIVTTLLDAYKFAGSHYATWYGTDGSGRPVASGTYYAMMRVGPERAVRKLVLLR